MKQHVIRLLGLLSILVLAAVTTAGTWSTNSFFYQPALGARGAEEKRDFDLGLERVDAHLGKYKTLGDPGYSTLAEALTTIGTSTKVTLTIPAGVVPVTGNTTIPENIALKILRGGRFDVDDSTLTIEGQLEAGPYLIFSCTGTGKVVLSAGSCQALCAEWWGAAGNGTTDDTDKVEAALICAKNAKIPLRFLAGKTYAVDQIKVGGSDNSYDHWQINAIGATILHNGDNKALLTLGSDAGVDALQDFTIFGGRWKAKQSATNPTTSVLLVDGGMFKCNFYDVEIWAGSSNSSKSLTRYADYGLKFTTTASKGAAYYNNFYGLKVYGGKVAGICVTRDEDAVTGTVTSAHAKNIIDAGANFVNNGVTAGMYVYNTTKKAWGPITNVTADTLTVPSWYLLPSPGNEVGDGYKVPRNSAGRLASNYFHGAIIQYNAIGIYNQYGNNFIFNGGSIEHNTSYGVSDDMNSQTSFNGVYIGDNNGGSSNQQVYSEGAGTTFNDSYVTTLPTTANLLLHYKKFQSIYSTNWFKALQAGVLNIYCDSSDYALSVYDKDETYAGIRILPDGRVYWYGNRSGDRLKVDRLRLNVLTAPPEDPADGDVCYADGVAWNPGAGAGPYVRTGGAWVKLP